MYFLINRRKISKIDRLLQAYLNDIKEKKLETFKNSRMHILILMKSANSPQIVL
jgi:hypothetical protein